MTSRDTHHHLTPPKRVILSLALPSPLRRTFDYLPPDNDPALFTEGMRVQVPFGARTVIGIIEAVKTETDCPEDKLRRASAPLEPYPLIPAEVMTLCRRAASYYHYSLGETLSLALPKSLRQGKPASLDTITLWSLTTTLDDALKKQLRNAKKQLALVEWLALYSEGVSISELKEAGFSTAILNQLQQKGLVLATDVEVANRYFYETENILRSPSLTLNEEQQFVLDAVLEIPAFHPVLLDGVTGSGKTEVYLQAIEATLKSGKQALVLVPEIGLTPQTVQRFQRRFHVPVICLHSGLNDTERMQGWLSASRARVGVVIATRSGIFTPLPRLGLIVVDEEHDGSYKQEDTLRYNARDLAIYRAKLADCPVVLGSATPSLESLANARAGRYSHLELRKRAGKARPPAIQLLDIRQQSLQGGLSTVLIRHMQETISRGEQVMVFLNRRGYAPSLICHDCGETMDCPHCDAHLTLHRQPPHMHCHHCDYQMPIPWQCPHCQSHQLQPVGQGTERVEQLLNQLFEGVPVLRIDRDSTRRKHALSRLLDVINEGHPTILLGTQMLAKGHHFPNVTLVAIINADAGLFSADFRGLEKTGQLIMQVAGRAGRGDKPGRVMIQTHNPQHPALGQLALNDYPRFAKMLFEKRHLLKLPPEGHLALFRTESPSVSDGEVLLSQLKAYATAHHPEGVSLSESAPRVLGPLPAAMIKRRGRYRHQLMIHCVTRAELHRLLNRLIYFLELTKVPRSVRCHLDVDPQEIGL